MADRRAKLLRDVLDAGAAIETFTAGSDFAGYCGNALLRSAVERQFEIIGEALRRLDATDERVFARISEAKRLIAFRNLIAHGYDGVDDSIVWQAIADKLPVLMLEAQALFSDIERTAD